MEFFQFGKTPRSLARASEAEREVSLMKRISLLANSRAAGESKGIPILATVSAKPMTPRPTRRLPLAMRSISGSG